MVNLLIRFYKIRTAACTLVTFPFFVLACPTSQFSNGTREFAEMVLVRMFV